jgi:hypothetical protein
MYFRFAIQPNNSLDLTTLTILREKIYKYFVGICTDGGFDKGAS